MTKQVIQLGTPPTGVGGDTPRSANMKINGNFDEVYAALEGLGPLATARFQNSPTETVSGVALAPGAFGLGGSIQVEGGAVGDFRPNGFYHISTNLTSGSPSGENGILKHWSAPGDPNFRILEYITWSGRIFTLTMIAGAWQASGWREAYNTGNTTRAQDGTLKAI
ncbi:hypothetical protein [Pseudomonas sp. T8]|uniref:hypothetical protein n=1 Tax=Pseudomonas sp. T8 TaxID=645292 RepID=UPI002148674C|nr:hypothetical protein [Pseudomonas sp. T8]UUT22171.1 hypothetical protein NRG23_31545 [Pseudomonas sp. T8]